MSQVVPVILCGGIGARLWPMSRASYPKQFVRFVKGCDISLLGATLVRLRPADAFGAPVLVCNAEHRFLVREELISAGIEPRAIVLEPVARNTAAAMAAGALVAAREDENAVLAIVPSDHIVRDETRFRTALAQAANVAATGPLVLFGIEPNVAHTGYGYVRRGDPVSGFDDGVFRVDGFYEKPDRAVADSYLASKDYFWNSGILVARARTIIDEIRRFEPAILDAVRRSLDLSWRDLGFLRLDAKSFAEAPHTSFDYAVLEKTDNATIMPIDVGWSDVGSWAALWQTMEHDDRRNYVGGDALLEDTDGCFVHSEKALVSTIGVKDLIIVNTPDALLVADKSRSQQVSDIVARLRQSNRTEHEQHTRSYRPWGYFDTLSGGPRFQVKLLHVNPQGKLSRQMHHHRSEHWVVVQGTAKLSIGDTERLLHENESAYILPAQWHRLENPGQTPLEIIEVQIGAYLGEDDIVRSDDIYQRAPDETK